VSGAPDTAKNGQLVVLLTARFCGQVRGLRAGGFLEEGMYKLKTPRPLVKSSFF